MVAFASFMLLIMFDFRTGSGNLCARFQCFQKTVVEKLLLCFDADVNFCSNFRPSWWSGVFVRSPRKISLMIEIRHIVHTSTANCIGHMLHSVCMQLLTCWSCELESLPLEQNLDMDGLVLKVSSVISPVIDVMVSYSFCKLKFLDISMYSAVGFNIF